MKKKLLSTILLGSALLSLSACGEDTSKTNSNKDASTEQSSKTSESKEQELKEVKTYNTGSENDMIKYRQQVAKLSNKKQILRLQFDVLPKLEENNYKFNLTPNGTICSENGKLRKAEHIIYMYPKNDQTKLIKAAIIYVNPELPKKAQVSFKVLNKAKTPKLYETLDNNIRS